MFFIHFLIESSQYPSKLLSPLLKIYVETEALMLSNRSDTCTNSVEGQRFHPRWIWLPAHSLHEKMSLVEVLGSHKHHKGAFKEVHRCS